MNWLIIALALNMAKVDHHIDIYEWHPTSTRYHLMRHMLVDANYPTLRQCNMAIDKARPFEPGQALLCHQS